VAQHARLFIGKENIVVLVHHGEAGGADLEIGIFLSRLFKKLVVYIQLHGVPRGKPRIAFCPFAVEFYPL